MNVKQMLVEGIILTDDYGHIYARLLVRSTAFIEDFLQSIQASFSEQIFSSHLTYKAYYFVEWRAKWLGINSPCWETKVYVFHE